MDDESGSGIPQAGPSPTLAVGRDGIARVVFDAPDRSANVLSESVMRRLGEIAEELQRRAERDELRGVVFTSAKPSFIVGADIDAIAEVESPDQGAEGSRLGQQIFLAVERLPVPTVAAIHGSCMGGGTELGLACRYRVASDATATKIGLPEVQLGILPAWGGTTRLPRLVGLQAALDLLLTGKPVDPRKARRIGLVDEILPAASFPDAADAFLEERIEDGETSPRTGARGIGTRLLDDTAPGRRIVLAAAKRRVMRQTGGHYPAPLRILDVVRRSFGRPVEEALELEARAAGELVASGVCRNLIHVFRLRERARKSTGVESDTQPTEVRRIGIVGAGTMGGGIAQLAAFHGLQVRLQDLRHEAVAQGLRHAAGLFDSAVKKRKLHPREADQAMERISGGVDGSGLAPSDLVVEAVVEKLEVKQSVFRDLEGRVGERCVLATNTSSLSVDAMAEGLRAPERVAGMHFFNPVHRMPLVEVVRGTHTDDRTVATVYALALRLGKVPVVVRDAPGFLVNRILGPYLNEAGHLLAEGASIERIDRVAKEFGMPMGPLRLIDEVGFDVASHAGRTLHEAFGDRLAPSAPLMALEETDRLGRKGKRGFYRYGRKKPQVDGEIYGALGMASPRRRSGPSDRDIRNRLVLAMINEGARALEEGVVGTAADVDLAMIMGTGFPPFRGGLLKLADEIHPRALAERLGTLEREVGPRFAAAPLLLRLSREDRGFYDVDRDAT